MAGAWSDMPRAKSPLAAASSTFSLKVLKAWPLAVVWVCISK